MKSFFIGNEKIKLPIIQGGIGIGVSLSGLALAVANEGGIGVISCAGLGLICKERAEGFINNNNWGVQEELCKARELTQGIIGVNIMVVLSNYADLVRTAIANKVDIIFSGAGLPLDLPCIRTCDYTKGPYCIANVLYNAAKGNMDKGYAFAGANA